MKAKTITLNSILILALVFGSLSVTAAIKSVAPEKQGMSSERLELISELATESIESENFPGGVVMVLKDGKLVFSEAYGKRSFKEDTPYRLDDIFRIASMTKAITTVAIMQLFEDGKILLDDPVHRYIPAFKDSQVLESYDEETDTYTTVPAKSAITLRHLLTHTSGLTYDSYGDTKIAKVYEQLGLLGVGLAPEWTTEEFVNRLAKAPLVCHPGEAYCYGMSIDVLGRVVEVVSGKSLSQYFQDHIFNPLKMVDTAFRLPESKFERLVPVYIKREGEWMMASDHEDGKLGEYPKWEDKGNYAGGGGLSSTAMDYARFCLALVNGGVLEGERILSRKAIETMTSDQMIALNQKGTGFSQTPGMTYCLGFSLTTEEAEGNSMRSAGTYEWGGYFSTKFIIDPKENLVFVGMGQTQGPGAGLWELWDKMISVTYSAIE